MSDNLKKDILKAIQDSKKPNTSLNGNQAKFSPPKSIKHSLGETNIITPETDNKRDYRDKLNNQ